MILLLLALPGLFGGSAKAVSHEDCPLKWQGLYLARVTMPSLNQHGRLECVYLGEISLDRCKDLPLPVGDGVRSREQGQNLLCQNYLNKDRTTILSVYRNTSDHSSGNSSAGGRHTSASGSFPLGSLVATIFTTLFSFALYQDRKLPPSRLFLIAVNVVVWAGYAIYSYRMNEWERTVSTPIRVDLLIILPVLGFLLLLGVIQLGLNSKKYGQKRGS